jgi:hypothetical protein
MKNILFIGGSSGLRLDKIFKKIFFADQEVNLVNLSKSGAGNFYIAGTLFEYLAHNKKPDYVFLKFTGLNRYDLPFNKKAKLYDYDYQASPFDNNWVFSGGYAGSWLKNDVLKKIFPYLYDLNNANNTNNQSWQQIFSALCLCEKFAIPHNWTFYYDVTDPPSDKSKQDGESTIPDYINQAQMLEQAPLNYSYAINQVPEDGNHYTLDVEEQYFKQPIIFDSIKKTINT